MKRMSILTVLLLVGIVGNVAAQDQHGPTNWYWNTPAARKTGELLDQATKQATEQAAKIAKIGKNVIFKYSYEKLQRGRTWVAGGNHFFYTQDTVVTKTAEKTCPVVEYAENAEEKTIAISIRQNCFDKFYKDIKDHQPSLISRDLEDTKTKEKTSISNDANCSQKHLDKNIIFTCKI